MSEATTSEKENVHSVLYVKDKFSVSNEAFHELSMLSNLPSSSEVKNHSIPSLIYVVLQMELLVYNRVYEHVLCCG